MRAKWWPPLNEFRLYRLAIRYSDGQTKIYRALRFEAAITDLIVASNNDTPKYVKFIKTLSR